MKYEEDLDNIEEMQAKDTEHELPIGWLILFFGLIIWGIWYFYTYSPMTTGWTQAGEFEKSMQEYKINK